MQAVFYGVGAAVIGIIAMSVYKLTTKSIGKDKLLWAIFLVSATATVVTKSEIIWIFLGAGVLVWLLRAPPKPWSGGSVTGSVIVIGQRSITDAATAARIRTTLRPWFGALQQGHGND